MRSIALLGMFSLALLAHAQPGGCREGFKDVLVVSGEGKASAEPDIAMVKIGATTVEPTAGEAYSENARIMQAVRNALSRMGVDEKDISTCVFRLGKKYKYVKGTREFQGYEMSHMYSVKIRRLEKVGEILDACAEAGANEISSITFGVENLDDLANEARKRAVQNAEQKAKLLAQEADVKLGRPTRISEAGVVPVAPARAEMAALKEAAPPEAPVEPGEYEVRARVTIHYQILE